MATRGVLKTLKRWRELAKMGCDTDRRILNEQADIVEAFRGRGDLEQIQMEWATIK